MSDWTRRHWEQGGISSILGLPVSQNAWTIAMFSNLLTDIPPYRIIELGTGNGGLSILLSLRVPPRHVHTYDLSDFRSGRVVDSHRKLGIQFHQEDIWTNEPSIADLISQDGRTWLLCDGGDKTREVETFAQYLKKGDVIGAHDCCPKRDVWRWHEVDVPRVEEVARRYHLEPTGNQHAEKAAWWLRWMP